MNDLHGAHHSGPPTSHEKLGDHGWPVSSAYNGWGLDEQLNHIRDVLDSISSLTSPGETASVQEPDITPPVVSHRFDTMHDEKGGLHRQTQKRDPLVGLLVFGLAFLVLGTSVLVLSIASIIPRQIWFPADVPIGSVLLQVVGTVLTGLGLAGQLRRFQAVLQTQEPDRRRYRIDEPQLEYQSPHLDAKVRS